MLINKKHWYDGKFYDRLIAPNQDRAFKIIKDIIKENSDVLDVGCGTGRLSFQLSNKCKSVDGIDLSEKNIKTAKKNLLLNPSVNIEFFHTNAELFLKSNKKRYNYAVFSYVIHEINESERKELLNLVSGNADKLIFIDYFVPRPRGFMNTINGIIEFAAGREHYKNFKTFVLNGGICGLTSECGLRITEEILNPPKTTYIAVFEKK